MIGRSAIAGVISISLAVFVVFNLSFVNDYKALLESADECMPCSTGKEDICHAGCLTQRGIRVRLLSVKSMQRQLDLLKKTKRIESKKLSSTVTALASTPVRSGPKGTALESVESAKRDILRENAQLLRLDKSKKDGLGAILNSVQKNLLRAEAAEVRMRRQAKLQGGDEKTITEVFQHLRFSSFRLFNVA